MNRASQIASSCTVTLCILTYCCLGGASEETLPIVPSNRWPDPHYRVLADGTFLGPKGEDGSPRYSLAMSAQSPDGRYVSYVTASGEVHLRELGEYITDEILSVFGSFPAWSPDGSELAWIGSTQNKNGAHLSELRIKNVRMGVTTELKGSPYFGGGLAWSPDGQKLCYADGGMHSTELKIFDRTTREVLDLPAVPAGWHHWWPAWSPEGTKIAYVCSDSFHSLELMPLPNYVQRAYNKTSRIWVTDLVNKKAWPIGGEDGHQCYPMWSLDAKSITYIDSTGKVYSRPL